MKAFSNISEDENKELLKFPAYISLMAANCDDSLDKTEKKSAIKFSHTKTFSCDPHLKEFYKQADNVFANNIEELDNALPKGKGAYISFNYPYLMVLYFTGGRVFI